MLVEAERDHDLEQQALGMEAAEAMSEVIRRRQHELLEEYGDDARFTLAFAVARLNDAIETLVLHIVRLLRLA